MATLLSKFRIDYSHLEVITDINKKPKKESQNEFNELISGFRMKTGETEESHPWKIQESDLSTHKDKVW